MTTVTIMGRETRVAINNITRSIAIRPASISVTFKPFGPQGLPGPKGNTGLGVQDDPGDLAAFFQSA